MLNLDKKLWTPEAYDKLQEIAAILEAYYNLNVSGFKGSQVTFVIEIYNMLYKNIEPIKI